MHISTTLSILLSLSPIIHTSNYSSINLPEEHLDYYFANSPALTKQCSDDPRCPYKSHLNKDKCWGYEYRCDWNKQYSRPRCPGDHKGWVKTKEDQERTFYTQADFGYVKERRSEMKVVCEPMFPDDSSLECADNLRFCRGRNLMINFTDLIRRDEPLRYKMDVLKDGEIGGYCNFYSDRLKSNLEHLSPLQSWAPELRFFKPLSERPIVENKCDVVIEKPTYIMKIDATVNMYHHFCDFVNLYASQHLNALSDDTFSTDVHVLIWETFTYSSAFQDTFKAFTRHQIWDLKTFRGETVCFKNLIFPLLPRMIFGMYYNTPIVYGCESSGLFRAFSGHVLHRLKVPLHDRINDKVRVTLLSRETKYRRILNEKELLSALEDDDDYEVRLVTFTRSMEFMKQLEVVRNSDVLIGMHGAGLTHLMFMPDWGAVFELYNCEDPNCYFDLTRLRGLKYITWEDTDKLVQEDEGNHPEGGAHAKFTNYSFDVEEFLRLAKKAKDHVLNHEKFNAFIDECLGAGEEENGKCVNEDYRNYKNVAEDEGGKRVKSATVSQCTRDKGDSAKCIRIKENVDKKINDIQTDSESNIERKTSCQSDRCQEAPSVQTTKFSADETTDENFKDPLNDDDFRLLNEVSNCQNDNSGTVEPLDYIDIDEIDLDLISEEEITISVDIKTPGDDENTQTGAKSVIHREEL